MRADENGPDDLSEAMWKEHRVHCLKTMLVFGRAGLRVAMGNTCAGVSSRAACGGREGRGVRACVCGSPLLEKRKGRQEPVGKATTSSPLSCGEVEVSGN